MASSSTPDPASVRPADGPVTARVRDPGELVAVVPVLLGFHPRDSLVVIGTGGSSGRRIGLTLRVDLPPPDDAGPVCRAAADSILAGDPAGAAVIVLGGGPGGGADGLPRSDVAAAMADELAAAGVEVYSTLWARDTAAGSPWACYAACGCSGLLPDPASTPVAAAAVAVGQVVYRDRAELERQVAPADPVRLRRRDALLDRALDAAAEAADAGDPDGPVGSKQLAVHYAALQGALDAAAAGRLALDDGDDDTVLALAAALRVPAIRDIALAGCDGPRAAAAEQLWAALTRETPDPEAAEPATLLAVAALVRGDGALVNVALDRAQQAWPGHRFSRVLGEAVARGLGPDQVRRWLREAGPPRPGGSGARTGAGLRPGAGPG
ncbi:DUF4192 domain-containing protein [Pseudonocardia acidicola]|uniref:DUF4192 domain-containing protein n=1 Tax=Pseudonocardia acidicola TaxID=2724939 RepID=A0ABX1S2R0_9PSEU|nr:DUF4192 domain-containing protein [Pseudonocardia acidicola]NMH95831.1 DUF4192 domain-containing protein [Pseudonocardia acidicola]